MEEFREVSLLQAVSELYAFNDKKGELMFDIVFPSGYDNDECKSGYHILIGKHWNNVFKDWSYLVKEPYCPTIAANENNFLGKLFSTGVKQMGTNLSFGGNSPTYTVYEGRYKDKILSYQGKLGLNKEQYEELLSKIEEELQKEENESRYNVLFYFKEEIEEILNKDNNENNLGNEIDKVDR